MLSGTRYRQARRDPDLPESDEFYTDDEGGHLLDNIGAYMDEETTAENEAWLRPEDRSGATTPAPSIATSDSHGDVAPAGDQGDDPPQISQRLVRSGSGNDSGGSGKRQRSESSSTGAEIGLPVRKAQRIRGVGKRARQGDYDQPERGIIDLSLKLFAARLCTDDAYPEKLFELTWAKLCWIKACNTIGVNIEHTDEIIKIVSDVSSSLHMLMIYLDY
jgi:hypothetical protein